jgi:predicted SPOUT superfamily RNA methylase MTH1
MQPVLKHVGLLPPLDMPHHLRKTDTSRFREGIVLETTSSSAQVDIGLDQPVDLMTSAPPPLKTRVTVDLEDGPSLVSPSVPLQHGIPWGYSVRVVPSFAQALVPAPSSSPYDLLIGLSERGTPIHELPSASSFPSYTRALIVLGGLAGLELSIDKEKEVLGVGAQESAMLFDFWVNVCPNQASRTIRTEEALSIGLAGLRERLQVAGRIPGS